MWDCILGRLFVIFLVDLRRSVYLLIYHLLFCAGSFLPPFFTCNYFPCYYIMSVDIEVGQLLEVAEGASAAEDNISLALNEVTTLLGAYENSLLLICSEAENASSSEALKTIFVRFNGFLRMFHEAAPDPSHANRVCKAVLSLPMGERFRALLSSASSLLEAANTYKR